jgi:hypothetical protein
LLNVCGPVRVARSLVERALLRSLKKVIAPPEFRAIEFHGEDSGQSQQQIEQLKTNLGSLSGETTPFGRSSDSAVPQRFRHEPLGRCRSGVARNGRSGIRAGSSRDERRTARAGHPIMIVAV